MRLHVFAYAIEFRGHVYIDFIAIFHTINLKDIYIKLF